MFDEYKQVLRWNAIGLARDGATFTARMSELIAADDKLLGFAVSALKTGQPPNFMLLSAVQYLLAQDRSSKLSRVHPFVTGRPIAADEIFPEFKAYCLRYADRIKPLLAGRSTQYTTPNRCALLAPCVAWVAERAGEPIALVDVGCALGLNLLLDCYGYDYGARGRVDNPRSSIVLPCQVSESSEALPMRLPEIGSRLGLDLHIYDMNDPDERRWQMANLFADWPHEQALIQSALALRDEIRPTLVQGDALELLEQHLAPIAGPLCVMHCNFLYQLSPAQRDRLDAVLRDVSRKRPVHRVGVDAIGLKLDPAEAARRLLDPDTPSFDITYTAYDGGDAQARILGYCDSWGRKLDWHPTA
ncbi:MAG: DUF2332 domain-containing protein [Gammaproteobacteria bacterium]